MNMNRVWTIFLRQYFLYKRSRYRLLGLFYWPAMELFLWGVLTIYISRAGGPRLSFVSVLIGAVIFSNFLMRIQHGITISFLEDVWVRNFMNLFASPLTIMEYILGLLITSLVQLVITIGFMAFLAWLLFSYNIFQFGFWLLPFAGILLLFGFAVGILVTGIILRLGPSSEILTWAIPAMISTFTGVFYPIDLFPQLLQWFAKALPSTYVFAGMRSVVLRGDFEAVQLLGAAVLAFLWLIVSYIFFVRVYRSVLKRGLFTRFLTD